MNVVECLLKYYNIKHENCRYWSPKGHTILASPNFHSTIMTVLLCMLHTTPALHLPVDIWHTVFENISYAHYGIALPVNLVKRLDWDAQYQLATITNTQDDLVYTHYWL